MANAALEPKTEAAVGLCALAILLIVVLWLRWRSGRKVEQVICLQCGGTIRALARRNFLGFPQFTCPACAATSVYPLHRVQYWMYVVFLVGAGAAITMRLLEGKAPLGNVAVLAAFVIALVQDGAVRRQVRLAEERARASAPPEQPRTGL